MREADLGVDDSEFDAMGIERLIALGREAGLRDLEELACRGDGAIVQAEVEDRYDEAALDDLECVDQWEYVTETADAHVYVIEFTAPDLPPEVAEGMDDLVGTCDPEVGDRGATMSLVGPQDAIAETIDGYERAGVSPDLRKLAEYDGGSRPLEDLTERQREVVETAFAMGYYEVPREASTEQVAAELGVDSSTVSEHLQRAERNLLADVLGE